MKNEIQDFLETVKENNSCYVGGSEADYISLIIRIESHGASGGNCWGRSVNDYVISDGEKASDLREKIFSFLSEGFLKDKLINKYDFLNGVDSYCDELIENDEDALEDKDYEYYGNFTVYKLYKVELIKLFEILKEKELINQEVVDLIKNEIENKLQNKNKMRM